MQQLYDLCRSQPLLGRCICLSLSPPAPSAAQGCTGLHMLYTVQHVHAHA